MTPRGLQGIFLRLATQDPDHFLIAPFDLSESHVYHKVTGMQEEGQGEQMPLNGPFLSEQQIQAISDWILEGAANN